MAAAAFALIASAAQAQQSYRVLDHWKIGGEGGWDYLLADSSAHRLYVTHGGRVEVLDSSNGKPVGAITGLQGTHGVALDTAGKFGYISDGRANAVIVFDRSNLSTVATIPAGTNPDGIVFEPATQTVWAFNGRSKNVTVIDAAARTVVATLPVTGKPEFPAVDGKGTVYVNIEDEHQILRFDAHARKQTATWDIPCDSPSGLAFDIAGARLFSVCDGKKMVVTDSNSGKNLGTAAIGDGPDAANYSPDKKVAFASSGDGVLSVVDAADASFPTIQSLQTARGARTMTYDPAADRAYLVTAEFGPRPAPTADNPRPRPAIVPGSFQVIVVGR
jgi:YVTN family beta-propeller protein